MASFHQDPMPEHNYGHAMPSAYQPYQPYQVNTSQSALGPQEPPQRHRLSQSYQAYQPSGFADNKVPAQDDQYQQFLQWQQFMQFQKTQEQLSQAPTAQYSQPLSPPLSTAEKRNSRVGWQNPYLVQTDGQSPSQQVNAPSHDLQPPVSPQTTSSGPTPVPANCQYFPPPPPSPAPYTSPYQHGVHTSPPPTQQPPQPQISPVYELASPSPPAGVPQPVARHDAISVHEYCPTPNPGPTVQSSGWRDFPVPLFSPNPSSALQSSDTQLLTPQSSAPQSPAPQAATYQTPAPQVPSRQGSASSPSSPQSLGELRERLEAAGLPDETIVAVLLQHTSLTTAPAATAAILDSVPQVEKTEVPTPQDLSANASSVEPPQLPPRLPPRPSLPTTNSSSTSIPTSGFLDKVVYNFYLAGTTRNSIHPVFRHHIEPAGGDLSQRSYITAFTLDTIQGKEPHLRIYRKEHNNNNNPPPQIATCLYYRSEWSQKVEIKSIWRAGSDRWEPELEPWKSETGTAAGRALQWQYDASRGGESLDRFVIRCATTIPKTRKSSNESTVIYIQGGAQSTGTPVEVEVCRIVVQDGDNARIEIPRFLLAEERVAEQMEEMICNAVVQIFRKRAGWTTKRAARTMNQVDSTHVNTGLKITSNALKVAGFFMKH